MKRAKLILAAIAVFAIAGGVYASKARQTNTLYKPSIQGGSCYITVRTTLTLTNDAINGVPAEYTLTPTAATCSTLVTTTN